MLRVDIPLASGWMRLHGDPNHCNFPANDEGNNANNQSLLVKAGYGGSQKDRSVNHGWHYILHYPLADLV